MADKLVLCCVAASRSRLFPSRTSRLSPKTTSRSRSTVSSTSGTTPDLIGRRLSPVCESAHSRTGVRIVDPLKASYGSQDANFAVTQLAQTTMRSELGKMTLDKTFEERESLNTSIVQVKRTPSTCGSIVAVLSKRSINVTPYSLAYAAATGPQCGVATLGGRVPKVRTAIILSPLKPNPTVGTLHRPGMRSETSCPRPRSRR